MPSLQNNTVYPAAAVAMIRPAAFSFNPETAENNFFQDPVQRGQSLQEKALAEFDAMVALLRSNGISVLILNDSSIPPKPDAIFPNNWFTCMDRQLIIFPMYAPSRRAEKRAELITQLMQHTGIDAVHDLSASEDKEMFLEGTGSMVIDHRNRIIYACISPRTHESLLIDFAKRHQYDVVLFDAADGQGRQIYHTNVLMCIADSFCVICAEAIRADQREGVLKRLGETAHDIIFLSLEQINSFAGNMLQLQNKEKEKLLILSTTAYRSLTPAQIGSLEKHNRLIVPDVSVIEQAAGGSVRCMMAELFL